MKSLLSMFGLSRGKAETPSTTPSIDAAIESLVSGTEPGIRQVSGYARKLRRAVTISLEYIDKLVETLPAALETSSKTYSSDAQISAYFSSVDELQLVFSQSPDLKAFFHDSANDEYMQAYALLCMQRKENTVTGKELTGETIHQEAIQTAVNFSDHKVLLPAGSEIRMREALKKCIFDALITRALQSITAFKIQQAELKDQERILTARLKARVAQGNELSKLLATVEVDQTEIGQPVSPRSETDTSPDNASAASDTPLLYLNEVNRILSEPEKFITLGVETVKLTPQGIKAGDNTAQASHTLRFVELRVANVLKRAVIVVRFPRNEMLRGQLNTAS